VTRRQALERAREHLARHKIEDAALEAEVFLCHILKITRTQLLTEPDIELKKRQEIHSRLSSSAASKANQTHTLPATVNSTGWISS